MIEEKFYLVNILTGSHIFKQLVSPLAGTFIIAFNVFAIPVIIAFVRAIGALIDIEAASSITRNFKARSACTHVTARGILAKMITAAILLRAFVNVLANDGILEELCEPGVAFAFKTSERINTVAVITAGVIRAEERC